MHALTLTLPALALIQTTVVTGPSEVALPAQTYLMRDYSNPGEQKIAQTGQCARTSYRLKLTTKANSVTVNAVEIGGVRRDASGWQSRLQGIGLLVGVSVRCTHKELLTIAWVGPLNLGGDLLKSKSVVETWSLAR